MHRNMPKAVIELSEHGDRIVNIVKARDGLRNKSQAIERILQDYEEQILDPAFRPEFVKDLLRTKDGPFQRIDSLDELL